MDAQMVELKEGMGRNGRKGTDAPVSCDRVVEVCMADLIGLLWFCLPSLFVLS